MARTSLLRLLARAHAAHRNAQATGSPPEAFFARRPEGRPASSGRLTRREALKAAGVLGALPILHACPQPETPTPEEPGRSVGIVGAGLAGLHCAYRLKRLGITATVYEAQSRLGGRVFSDRDTFAGQGEHCELGGELIDSGHLTMHDLAAELDIELLDYEDDDASLEALVAFFGGARQPVSALLEAYAPIAARIDEDLATITGDGYVTFDAPNNGEALDALSIRAWFDQLVAAGTIDADNMARKLFEVAYNIEYGLETDQQCVLNMHFLTSTALDELALFGDSDERFHARDGNDVYIQKLAQAVTSQIETERRLVRVAQLSDGRIRLAFDNGAEATHDRVVLALPFTMLREVEFVDVPLSSAKRKAIEELGYGTNAKLMVGFDARPWRTGTPGSNGETYTDLGYQASWETSRLQSGTGGIITNYTGGTAGLDAGNGSPAERAADFLSQFEQVFPGSQAAANGRVARFHWPTNAFVKGSYACYLVGQYTTITGSEALPERNLHFCGEHTSLDAQGYMEGAALSGAVAADEVAAALGVDAAGQALDDAQPLLVESPELRILQRARTVKTRRRWHRRSVALTR